MQVGFLDLCALISTHVIQSEAETWWAVSVQRFRSIGLKEEKRWSILGVRISLFLSCQSPSHGMMCGLQSRLTLTHLVRFLLLLNVVTWLLSDSDSWINTYRYLPPRLTCLSWGVKDAESADCSALCLFLTQHRRFSGVSSATDL